VKEDLDSKTSKEEEPQKVFNWIVGVVDNDKLNLFRKLLFRMSRGKIFSSFFTLKNNQSPKEYHHNWNSLEEIMESPIEKFISNENILRDSTKYLLNQEIICKLINECKYKSGFLIVLSGPIREFFQPKINKLIESFEARSFEFPSSGEEMSKKLNNIQEEVSCCLHILTNSIMSLKNSSLSLSSPPLLSPNNQAIPSFQVLKSELLATQFYLRNLNYFVQNKSFLHGLFWVPSKQVDDLKHSIDQFNQNQESSILKITEESPDALGFKPPTSFYGSNFLNQFQEIVNTYGIPKYREINPAVFTAITFPFLFGLMFGDIAHGFVLFCFAFFLFYKSQSISNSLNTSFMTIRSLAITMLLMGMFSVYVGFVYNDFLALPLTFFPSCYNHNGGKFSEFN
jgi:V-type H+-transporting ATPase subunit a